jgi:hypothetical protein
MTRIFEEIKLETPSDPLSTILSYPKSTCSVIPKIHKLTLNSQRVLKLEPPKPMNKIIVNIHGGTPQVSITFINIIQHLKAFILEFNIHFHFINRKRSKFKTNTLQ